MIILQEICVPTDTGFDWVTLTGATEAERDADRAQHLARSRKLLERKAEEHAIPLKGAAVTVDALACVVHAANCAADGESAPEERSARCGDAAAICEFIGLDGEIKAAFEVVRIAAEAEISKFVDAGELGEVSVGEEKESVDVRRKN